MDSRANTSQFMDEEYSARENSMTSISNQGTMYVHRKQQLKKTNYNFSEVKKTFNFKWFKRRQQGNQHSECRKQKRDWCLDSEFEIPLVPKFAFLHSGWWTSQVKFASGASVEIKGKGRRLDQKNLQCDSRNVQVFDTLYVLDLGDNFISVAKIVDKGYKVLLDRHQAEILNEQGEPKEVAKQVDDLYAALSTP